MFTHAAILAVTLLSAAGGDAPAHKAVASRIHFLEMPSLQWRNSLHGRLQPVGQQGTTTIWTGEKASLDTLKAAAKIYVDAPCVTSDPGTPASIESATEHHFVAHLKRVADGPVFQATALAFQPEIATLKDGYRIQVIGRPLDQGILANIAIEESQLIAVETVTLQDGVKGSPAHGTKPSKLNAEVQVPEVASARVNGEWLVPKDGVLVISLGARRVPVAGKLLEKSELHERLIVVESSAVSVDSPRNPHAPQVPLPPVPVGPSNLPHPNPFDIVMFGSGPHTFAVPSAVMGYAPRVFGFPQAFLNTPEIVVFDTGSRNSGTPKGFGPGAYPAPPAPRDASAGQVAYAPTTSLPRIPFPNLPWVSEQAASEAPAALAGPCHGPLPEGVAAVPATDELADPVKVARLPRLPSRAIPQGYNANGQPVELPPLPEEALASTTPDPSGTPRATPQARNFAPPATTQAATLAASSDEAKTNIELQGNVRLSGPNGEITAQSIVITTKRPAKGGSPSVLQALAKQAGGRIEIAADNIRVTQGSEDDSAVWIKGPATLVVNDPTAPPVVSGSRDSRVSPVVSWGKPLKVNSSGKVAIKSFTRVNPAPACTADEALDCCAHEAPEVDCCADEALDCCADKAPEVACPACPASADACPASADACPAAAEACHNSNDQAAPAEKPEVTKPATKPAEAVDPQVKAARFTPSVQVSTEPGSPLPAVLGRVLPMLGRMAMPKHGKISIELQLSTSDEKPESK